MASHKAHKSGFLQKYLSTISQQLIPYSCTTHIDVQKQLSTAHHHITTPIGPLPSPIAAGSLAMGTSPSKNTQRSTPNVAPLHLQDQQLKKMSNILHVLLDEKQVEEKIRQILHGLMNGMAKQVLVQNGTALSADVMESKVRKLEGHLERKKEELSSSLEKENRLQMEMEEVKSKQSASCAIEIEGLPSPTMLQEALHDVYKALMECATKLYSELTKHLQPSPYTSVWIFQHQLCTSFFMGFETLSFNVTQDLNWPDTFEKPKDLKLHLFEEFNCYKALDVMELLQDNKQVSFQAFINSKYDQFVSHRDARPFEDASHRDSCLNSMLDSERGPVYLEFLGLCKATWLLHKLAFALEPTAEIFRVQPNSNYDAEYMEADQEMQVTTTKVWFMAMPGFTIRNLVFKAHVYLKA